MSMHDSQESSSWTHACCRACWSKSRYNLMGKEPVRVLDDDEERCCFCGEATSEGIYVREPPEKCLWLNGGVQ